MKKLTAVDFKNAKVTTYDYSRWMSTLLSVVYQYFGVIRRLSNESVNILSFLYAYLLMEMAMLSIEPALLSDQFAYDSILHVCPL